MQFLSFSPRQILQGNLLITVLAVIALPSAAIAQYSPATVVNVGDGDDVLVQSQDGEVEIRLGCVDAPEMAQHPWGATAAARLKTLLPQGQSVQIREIKRDRYGRTVAEVFLNNQSIDLQMVREGMAVVYRRYLDSCPNSKNLYLQAEQTARHKGLGVWNPKNPMKVMPWDFRKLNRRSG